MESINRLQKYYTACAVLFFNTFLLLACLNVGVLAYIGIDDDFQLAPEPTIPNDHPLQVYELRFMNREWEDLRHIYYYLDSTQMLWLLLEDHNRQICDEVTGYRAEPIAGRYFNVDPVGFRHGWRQAPWEPSDERYNVFVFGGSTTYGTGVADRDTIPSFLQRQLQTEYGGIIAVYNFGSPGFISEQERLRLEWLLEQDIVPDLAIFVDGLNDVYNWAGGFVKNCPQSKLGNDRWRNTLLCEADEFCLPMQSLASQLITPEPPTEPLEWSEIVVKPEEETPPMDDTETNRLIIDRWLENKAKIEALSEKYGFETYFVWQPVPGFAFDLAYHRFNPTFESLGGFRRHRYVYAMMEELAQDASWTSDFLNMSRLAEGFTWNIWLDSVHYTPGFNEQIAQAISDGLVSQGLIDIER